MCKACHNKNAQASGAVSIPRLARSALHLLVKALLISLMIIRIYNDNVTALS